MDDGSDSLESSLAMARLAVKSGVHAIIVTPHCNLPDGKGLNADEVSEHTAALTHALAVSFAGKIRVNSISPGWIDTAYRIYEGPDADQQPAGRVGNPTDIANAVLFLCSDKAGFITGENLCIDGGMTKLMIYHGDNGWTFR